MSLTLLRLVKCFISRPPEPDIELDFIANVRKDGKSKYFSSLDPRDKYNYDRQISTLKGIQSCFFFRMGKQFLEDTTPAERFEKEIIVIEKLRDIDEVVSSIKSKLNHAVYGQIGYRKKISMMAFVDFVEKKRD